MKHSLVFIVIATCISILLCTSFFWNNTVRDREKIANEITEKTAEKIIQEKGLILVGTGGGMIHGVMKLNMSFFYYKEVDLDTARNLLVYCVEEYLTAINSNKAIRPYLINYPFTEKNIQVNIFFYQPDRSPLPAGKISVAGAVEGKVDFQTKGQGRYELKTVHKETYDEARKIAQAQKCEVAQK